MRLAGLILLLLGAAAPAAAENRGLTSMWTIEEAPPPAATLEVAREDYVLKQRLLPTGLVELTAAPGTGGPEGFQAGSQLIEIRAGEALVFCDPAIRPQKLIGHAQYCFVDADRDGRLEGAFLTSSVTKGILTLQGNRPKSPKGIAPLAYRRIDPAQFSLPLFVGLQYRGSANIGSDHVFEIRYGGPDQTDTITRRIVYKKENVPGAMDFMGGRFTILSAAEGKIRVHVDRAMPTQPFAVMQTTTYRIY